MIYVGYNLYGPKSIYLDAPGFELGGREESLFLVAAPHLDRRRSAKHISH